MKLEINLTKGKFWALMVVGILLVGVLVYAAANSKPNPGHGLDEIDLSGLTAESIKGLDQKILTLISTNLYVNNAGKGIFNNAYDIECDNGDQLVGGGCDCTDTDSGVEESYPDFENNGWHCECDDAGSSSNKDAYVICLKKG